MEKHSRARAYFLHISSRGWGLGIPIPSGAVARASHRPLDSGPLPYRASAREANSSANAPKPVRIGQAKVSMHSPAPLPRTAPLGQFRRPIRVLLVEDDHLYRMILERFVLRQRLPYEIVTAESGMAAQQKLRAGAFDVVLLDYMLGDMTGLDLLPELRGTPAIFITGVGTEEIAANAMRLGAYGYLVKDAGNAYLNMLPVLIGNVLERKQAEDAFLLAQRRLNAVLSNVAGMEYGSSADPERRLHAAAGGCRDLTGYSSAELTAAGAPSLSSLIAAEDRARVTAALADAIGRGRPLDCTYRLRARGGALKWVRDHATVVLGANGAATGLEGFLTDVTFEEAAENSLRRAKEVSDEAVLVKDRLMALVVHDLRAPLSTILLSVQQMRMELRVFAETLNIPDGTESRQRFAQLFDGMTDRAQDMLRMIDQLLLSSRLRSGVLTPATRPLSGARLASMTEALVPLAAQKGIALSCQVPPSFRLLADPDLLAEVVQNLLTNAIKFTRTGGTIRVVPLEPGVHGFSVQDTGVGIAPERLPLLFKREARGTTPGTAGERGTGIGLAMCREIVEAHGGTLSVRSTPGQGSDFRVVLPAAVPRLLAVSLRDADAAVAEATAGGLEGEVQRATGSDEALRLAGERTPQAVLVDGATPSAVKTLHAVRADAVLRGVPVLWLGPPEPPLGSIPDDRLTRPLESSALRAALRFSFGD